MDSRTELETKRDDARKTASDAVLADADAKLVELREDARRYLEGQTTALEGAALDAAVEKLAQENLVAAAKFAGDCAAAAILSPGNILANERNQAADSAFQSAKAAGKTDDQAQRAADVASHIIADAQRKRADAARRTAKAAGKSPAEIEDAAAAVAGEPLEAFVDTDALPPGGR